MLLDSERLWVLSLVCVLRSDEDFTLIKDLCAQLVVGDHPFNRSLDEALRVLLTDFLRSLDDLVTDETSVASVNFLSLFVSAKSHLLSVDNDNVVTTVNVRGEDCLVLATEETGGFHGDMAEWLACGVDKMPLAFNVYCFC